MSVQNEPAPIDIENEINGVRQLLSVNAPNALQQCLLLCERIKHKEVPPQKIAELYHLIGFAYHDAEQSDVALDWYNQSLKIRREIEDRKGMAATLNNMGLIFLATGAYQQCIACLEESAEIKKILNDTRSLAASYENLGVAYQKLLKYKEAIEKFYESLKISEQNNDVLRMATTYLNIGNTHHEQGDNLQALKMFETALLLIKDTDNHKHILQLLNNMAVAFKHLNRTQEALDNYRHCLSICNEQGYLSELSTIYNNMGEMLMSEGKTEEAIEAYQKSIAQAAASHHVEDEMVAEMNLGSAYLKQGDFKQAELLLTSSLKKYNESSVKQGAYYLYESLINLYECKGELSKAIEYFRRFDQYKYEQLSTENLKIVNELKTKYEVEKKEKENEINRLRNIELKDALEDLTLEKHKSEKLLLNILPEEIAYELKRTGKVKAKLYNEVTVMFADIQNFTGQSEKLSPDEIVKLLDHYFHLFDEVTLQLGIEKIKTIGDAYLCVAGLPEEKPNNAVLMVNAALQIGNKLKADKSERIRQGLPVFSFRFGIHTGPVIAGIVGKSKFEFDIWGDAVNTAARMEQSGEIDKINVSGVTYQLIKEQFNCTYRGKVEAKNKGAIDMYFVNP